MVNFVDLTLALVELAAPTMSSLELTVRTLSELEPDELKTS